MPRVGSPTVADRTLPSAAPPAPKPVASRRFGYATTDVLDPLPAGVPAKLHPSAPSAKNELMVASYNIENLFDTLPDATVKDGTQLSAGGVPPPPMTSAGFAAHQFTPDGDYKWTDAKLAKNLANLGQSIRSMNGGKGPDILALNEVENASVVAKLRDEALGDLGYTTLCHLDTEDKRGIDNAILSKHPMIGEPELHTVHKPGDPLWKDQKTRGILEATFDVGGTPLTVLVNHWPAGLSWKERELQREDVGKQLRAIIEAKLAIDPDAEIIALGDFNANPTETGKGLGASGDPESVKGKKAPVYGTLACLADQLLAAKGKAPSRSLAAVDALLKSDGPAMGTHYDSWSKKWNALDQIFVSRGLLDDQGLSWVPGSTQIARSATISEGGKPRSTFPSEKYGEHTVESIGVSDHYPLVARLVKKTP
jgi:endonuclease/exonuclease/phosphatase family metal-dependent hydrolase